MRNAAVIMSVIAACAVLSTGDVVYLRNGDVYEGKVVRRDTTEVVIEVRGREMKIAMENVLHVSIEEDEATGGEAAPTGPGPADTVGDIKEVPFAPEHATRPETIVFQLMRVLLAGDRGPEAYDLRKQIEQWRISAHDRMRRNGPNWISPQETVRMREAFEAELKQVQDLLRRTQRYSPAAGRSRTAPQPKPEWLAAMTRLRQTAEKWPDPLLREFLVGLAYRQAEDHENAAVHFLRCRAAAPRVAAFRQAYGATLMDLNRPAEALGELTEVLRLWPGTREGIWTIQEALKATPGGMLNHPNAVAAKDLMAEYEDVPRPKYVRKGDTWLMPGRSWYVPEQTLLPIPLFDRLAFRQAVGVPIGKHTLLVDAAVVNDAQDIFVRIDADTLLSGTIRRVSYMGVRKEEPPLAFVTVEQYEFSPLEFGKDVRAATDSVVALYGLNLYEEMGRSVRVIPARIKSVDADGAVALSEPLLPGEAAGPVVTHDGKLLGVLAGRIDVTADNGGPDAGIPPAVIADLIERAAKGATGYTPYGRVRRKDTTTRPAPGLAFVVYATATERFE